MSNPNKADKHNSFTEGYPKGYRFAYGEVVTSPSGERPTASIEAKSHRLAKQAKSRLSDALRERAVDAGASHRSRESKAFQSCEASGF